MYLHVTTPPTPAVNAHEISRAANLVDLINEEINKALPSLDIIELSEKTDVDTLLIEANILNRDLHKIWYKLRKIAIGTYCKGITHSDLTEITLKIIKLSRNLDCVSKKDPKDLKDSIKQTLTDFGLEVGALLEVVKDEKSNDSKRDIVDVINFICHVVEKIALRNSLHKVPLEALRSSLEDRYEWFSDALYGITVDNQYVVRHVISYIHDGMYRMFIVEDMLFEDALHCDEECVQQNLLHMCHKIGNALSTLDKACRTNNSLKSLQLTIHVCGHTMICLVFDALSTLQNSQGDDAAVHNRILLYIIQSISLANTLVRGFKHITSVQSE